MVRLTSVGVLSVAKIAALLYAGMSLLIIPIFVIMMAVMSAMPQMPNQPPAFLFGIFALIAPFFYGAIGFVTGALAAFLYNLVAGWIGGIEMQFESVVPVMAVQSPASIPSTATLPPTSPSLPQA
jgi:hypothetical protein